MQEIAGESESREGCHLLRYPNNGNLSLAGKIFYYRKE